jgi:hypothetical protein
MGSPPVTNFRPSTWVAVDGNFYRIVFGEEPTTEEEQQESLSERARRMSSAFVRRCISVKHRGPREPRTPPASSIPGSARDASPSSLPAAGIAALVDIFRILQAWDDEPRR